MIDIDSLDNRDLKLIERFYRQYHRLLEVYFRSEVRGLERVPTGPGLYVGNHSSGLMTPDSFILGSAIYRAHGPEGLPYGLGHELAIRMPGLMRFLSALGAVRASHENAHGLFARGHKVLVYPGGDLDNMRPFSQRDRIVFGGRRGYIRLALREEVPIIPVVSAGAHETLVILDDGRWIARLLRLDKLIRSKVWPISLCLPWGLVIGPPLFYIPWPARILIEALEPIRFERGGPEAAADEPYVRECADDVEGAMQRALDRLSEERRAAKRRGLALTI